MTALDLDSPAMLWAGALWEWARSGDMGQVLDLLRGGVPPPPEHAATLADIIDGTLRANTPSGGPSAARQAAKRRRDDAVRALFPLILAEVRREQGRRHRGVDTRWLACERLAAAAVDHPLLAKRMTAEQVQRIVDTAPRARRWQAFDELVNTPKNSR